MFCLKTFLARKSEAKNLPLKLGVLGSNPGYKTHETRQSHVCLSLHSTNQYWGAQSIFFFNLKPNKTGSL